MKSVFFVLAVTYFRSTLSWTFEEIIKEKLNSALEESENKITGLIKDIDTSANLLGNTVQSYFAYQEKKITDGFYQYVDLLQEKQREMESEMDSYVNSLKYKSRRASKSFGFLKESHDSINPDVYLSAPEIIKRHGYNCETHTVISQEYFLNLHRIPSSSMSSKTILLQHGLFGSSVDWILNGPEKSLAYLLADAGYDVWMSNIRGNRYSRNHTYLNTDSEEYWNFSWHDVAANDIPNVVDYIIEYKGYGTEIVYIGHSMGTTMLFAMLTVRPEYNAILKAGYALAPIVFFTNFKSPIKSLLSIASKMAYIEGLYGSHEFVPKNSALGQLTRSCRADTLDSFFCQNILFYFCGHNEEQYNETILPVFLSHLGTGTPWKTIVHFSQLVKSGKFQQFDYGGIQNVFHYGSFNAPEYDLNRVKLPISLFWAQNDLLSSEEDVMLLKSKLKTKINMYEVPYPKFNHLDYIWAIDLKELLNDKILELLKLEFTRSTLETFYSIFQ